MNKNELLIKLATHLDILPEDVEHILKSAPYRYKHYTLKKRGGGARDIYHPTPEMKAIQTWLVANIFAALPVHESVYSYRSGLSIADHARVHVKSKFVTKLDLQSFFPSIAGIQVRAMLRAANAAKRVALTDDAIATIVRFCCRGDRGGGDLRLSIGSPSSPAISNAILYGLDESLKKASHHVGVTYTRYADDLYFSTSDRDVLAGVERAARSIIARYGFLKVNEDKTQRTSKKRRVVITGLTATSAGGVSIGRGRKRKIKTELYLHFSQRLPLDKIGTLRGLVSFSMGVEPNFYHSLCLKFGENRMRAFIADGGNGGQSAPY